MNEMLKNGHSHIKVFLPSLAESRPCSLSKQRKAQVQELTSFPPDQEGRANLTTVYRIGIQFFHSNVITGYHLNYAAAAQCGCNNESS